MSAVVIEARFAGGTITVDRGHLTHAEDQPVVILDAPGANDIILFSHESRNLARALLNAADEADAAENKILRRRAEVDQQLMERDV